MSLCESNLLELKKEKEKKRKQKSSKIIKCIIIKNNLYFIISLLFLLFFWYFLSCFCAVYHNTQLFLIKDLLINFALSLITPFFICLLPGIFRIPALRSLKKDNKFLYTISKVAQII